MHGTLNRRRDEHGAVAVLVAFALTAILIVIAMVLDFGLVRVDRQIDKSSADSATLAGLHALNGGDSSPRPFSGVCAAINYLQQNNGRFSAMTPAVGAWSDGGNPATSILVNPCTTAAYLNQGCTSSTATWAKFSWRGSMDGKPLNVVIQSGYLLSTTSGYSEDSLPAASTDNDDLALGCDQLAVFINQQRAPGLGSLATSSDLKTSIRSVGRVKSDTGGYAPAMLLLEQDTCPVLRAGSSSGGSFIHVLGAESSDGKTQPGTIHSDSSAGSSCSGGSNQNLFLGNGADGVVAYAAPVSGSPSTPDPTKPGQLSSYAGSLGKPLNYIIDTDSTLINSYAASGVNASAPGTPHLQPVGRPRVTRSPIDSRYFAGVKGALNGASTVFAPGGTSGYATFAGNQCSPTQATIDALNLTVASRLFINCTTNTGFDPGNLTIPAGTVFFNGLVGSSGNLVLSNAHHVYIAGKAGKDGIVLGGSGAAFSINTSGNLTSGQCGVGQKASKAVLFIKQGGMVSSTNNTLRFCRTTVFMMGGQSNAPNIGCVPTLAGLAPTATPCPGSLAGSGLIKQTGGNMDWTAPDNVDVTIGADGLPTAAATAGWSDTNGPEDLALWSESAGSYDMNGSGVFSVRGVFMVPNAFPFSIGGGANMNLVNAQFIARTIALNGTGTHVTMKVDGNSSVRLPQLQLVGLVR